MEESVSQSQVYHSLCFFLGVRQQNYKVFQYGIISLFGQELVMILFEKSCDLSKFYSTFLSGNGDKQNVRNLPFANPLTEKGRNLR